MKPLVVVLLIAGAAACSLEDRDGTGTGDGGGGDDDGGDPTELTCVELAERLRARALATSKECAGPQDCQAVGWPADRDGFPTCNCGAAFAGSCGGDPVNAGAWAADATARALLEDWQERCVRPGPAASGAPGICDCGPGGVGCVDNRCVSSTHDCFVLDAGMP